MQQPEMEPAIQALEFLYLIFWSVGVILALFFGAVCLMILVGALKSPPEPGLARRGPTRLLTRGQVRVWKITGKNLRG